MAVLKITQENFEQEVVNSGKPVILDFWATWCGPCQMQGPVFEEAAEKLSDRAAFGKVDVDQQQALAEKFQVMSIPTLVVLNQGQVVTKAVGFQALEQIQELIP